MGSNTHPEPSTHVSLVHGLKSTHTRGEYTHFPPSRGAQMPSVQSSTLSHTTPVQAFSPRHVLNVTQPPVACEHSDTTHSVEAGHCTSVDWQPRPGLQDSMVHGFPSSSHRRGKTRQFEFTHSAIRHGSSGCGHTHVLFPGGWGGAADGNTSGGGSSLIVDAERDGDEEGGELTSRVVVGDGSAVALGFEDTDTAGVGVGSAEPEGM
mmetsp:Transcript_26172/g.65791  ORF Transcript_26172/g.65791 Transcript_26172/m.65791 type:complete len:207 (+) Transcript_26172:921-1541(+)